MDGGSIICRTDKLHIPESGMRVGLGKKSTLVRIGDR